MIGTVLIGAVSGAVGVVVARRFTLPAVQEFLPGGQAARQFQADAIVALHAVPMYVIGASVAGRLPKKAARQVVGRAA